jgi:hypothetical protein
MAHAMGYFLPPLSGWVIGHPFPIAYTMGYFLPLSGLGDGHLESQGPRYFGIMKSKLQAERGSKSRICGRIKSGGDTAIHRAVETVSRPARPLAGDQIACPTSIY